MEIVDSAIGFLPTAIFLVIGTLAVASSILVVAMRNPVHSALFLLFTFLCVAVIFILAGAEFVGAVQVLVYAGGIMVLFLFVVMLINVRDLPNQKMLSPHWKGAAAVGVLLLLIFATTVRTGNYRAPVNNPKALGIRTVTTIKRVQKPSGKYVRRRVKELKSYNSEAVADALYRDYLVPFEVASVFLLVAMIGAIIIGKRDLGALEEESVPAFISERAADEKAMKEAAGA